MRCGSRSSSGRGWCGERIRIRKFRFWRCRGWRDSILHSWPKPQNGGSFVARQKPLKIGQTVGNDYEVQDGIKPGDKVIISGTQFLRGRSAGDSAELKIGFPFGRPASGFSRFNDCVTKCDCFSARYRKPIGGSRKPFSTTVVIHYLSSESCTRDSSCLLSSLLTSGVCRGCALLIVLAGAAVMPTLPIAQFPNLAPPQVGVTSIYIGASAQTVESAVTIPHRTADQRRGGDEVHHFHQRQ